MPVAHVGRRRLVLVLAVRRRRLHRGGLNGYLAYGSNRTGSQFSDDIYVSPLDVETPTRLTFRRADDGQPAWSPDGQRIAFKTAQFGSNQLAVINADGSHEALLTRTFRFSEGQPSWSPDATKLIYRRTPENPLVQNGDTWILDIEASKVDPANPVTQPVLVLAGDDRYPTFAPDGAQIAFRHGDDLIEPSGDEEVYVMDADGTNVRRLTDSPGLDEGPVWSPDGTKIAFSSDRDGQQEIYVMNADGSDPRRLTDNPARDESPDWQALPFDDRGHVACGDVSLASGGASSVAALRMRCHRATRIAQRWADAADAGAPPAKLKGLRCTSDARTYDLVVVQRNGRGRCPRGVAFVWRDPAKSAAAPKALLAAPEGGAPHDAPDDTAPNDEGSADAHAA